MVKQILVTTKQAPLDPKIIQITRMYVPSLNRSYQHVCFVIDISKEEINETSKLQDNLNLMKLDELLGWNSERFEIRSCKSLLEQLNNLVSKNPFANVLKELSIVRTHLTFLLLILTS